jgi:hypothetical protein
MGTQAAPPQGAGEAQSGGRFGSDSSSIAGECTAKEIWPSGQLKRSAVVVISNVTYSRRKLSANAAIAASRVTA